MMGKLEGVQAILQVAKSPESAQEMIRELQLLVKAQERPKEIGSINSLTNTEEQSKIPTVITEKCPVCNGRGFVSAVDIEGVERWGQCQCILAEMQKSRLKSAQIPENFRDIKVKDFDINIYQQGENREQAKIIKKVVARYIEDFPRYQDMGKGFYFYSEMPGTGKTRMAISLGNALNAVHGCSVRFSTTIDLLNGIKATFGDNEGKVINYEERTQDQFINAYRDIHVLILDDIGTENPTPWVNEIFYSILNYRADSKKITIFTSNCQTEGLRYAPKIVERIIKMSMPLEFPDESVRLSLAKKDNGNMLAELMN